MHLLLVLMLGCRPPVVPTPARGGATYDVVVVAASGDRSVEELFTLQVSDADLPSAWVVQTVESQGTWTEGSSTRHFDSVHPTASTPWPIQLQMALARVPAVVEFDAQGAPVVLADPIGWKKAVRKAMYALDLPVAALNPAESLVDPDGFVAELRRYFPGRPPTDVVWERQAKVAGARCTVTELCVENRPGGWTCEGTALGPTDGDRRLHEVHTYSEIRVDRVGLVSLEQGYDGTMVLLAPDGKDVVDRPIVGKRLVERR